jgi:hypothetical protein
MLSRAPRAFCTTGLKPGVNDKGLLRQSQGEISVAFSSTAILSPINFLSL